MTIRLHPATPHGDQLHRLGEQTAVRLALMRVRRWDVQRIDWTMCGIPFAWDSWKGRRGALPRCPACWP